MMYRTEECYSLYRDIELITGLKDDVVDVVLMRLDLLLRSEGHPGIEALLKGVIRTPPSVAVVNKFLRDRKGEFRLLCIEDGAPKDITVKGAQYEIREDV